MVPKVLVSDKLSDTAIKIFENKHLFSLTLFLIMIMIVGYLIRKINILLFVFIVTGCSTANNNISDIYNDIFVKKMVHIIV